MGWEFESGELIELVCLNIAKWTYCQLPSALSIYTVRNITDTLKFGVTSSIAKINP